MRDPQVIEAELMEISAIADDSGKLERLSPGAQRIPTKCPSTFTATCAGRHRHSSMVRTYGLTHINLIVRDANVALRFYQQVFGVREYSSGAGLLHASTPGCHDVITFDDSGTGAGATRGIAYFGFRLVSPEDIDAAVQEVERAGGRLLRRGEFAPATHMLTWRTRTGMRSRSGLSETVSRARKTDQGPA